MTYEEKIRWLRRYQDSLRRERKLAEELEQLREMNGQPHGSGVGNPTAQKAEALLAVQTRNEEKIAAVRRAMARTACFEQLEVEI